MTTMIYRCDDEYFKTVHKGRKPPPEKRQKAELMGGDNCDKDERWANDVLWEIFSGTLSACFRIYMQPINRHGNLFKGNGESSYFSRTSHHPCWIWHVRNRPRGTLRMELISMLDWPLETWLKPHLTCMNCFCYEKPLTTLSTWVKILNFRPGFLNEGGPRRTLF